MNTHRTDQLLQMLETLRAGAAFYHDAGRNPDPASWREHWELMAEAKRAMAADLVDVLGSRIASAPHPGGESEELRSAYACCAASLEHNRAIALAMLRNTESRVLELQWEALDETHDPSVRQVLERHYGRGLQLEGRLRALSRDPAQSEPAALCVSSSSSRPSSGGIAIPS